MCFFLALWRCLCFGALHRSPMIALWNDNVDYIYVCARSSDSFPILCISFDFLRKNSHNSCARAQIVWYGSCVGRGWLARNTLENIICTGWISSAVFCLICTPYLRASTESSDYIRQIFAMIGGKIIFFAIPFPRCMPNIVCICKFMSEFLVIVSHKKIKRPRSNTINFWYPMHTFEVKIGKQQREKSFCHNLFVRQVCLEGSQKKILSSFSRHTNNVQFQKLAKTYNKKSMCLLWSFSNLPNIVPLFFCGQKKERKRFANSLQIEFCNETKKESEAADSDETKKTFEST